MTPHWLNPRYWRAWTVELAYRIGLRGYCSACDSLRWAWTHRRCRCGSQMAAEALARALAEQPITTVEGIRLTNVHNPAACAGRPCVVHAPTDHHMRSWPLHWRDDRGIFERICEHGTGHPDPDQFDFWRETVHGCDGCCRGDAS